MAVAALHNRKDKSGYRDAVDPAVDRSCVRCAHYRHGEMDAVGMHLCERPELGSTRDRVIGAEVPNTRDAYDERRDLGSYRPEDADVLVQAKLDRCGPEGKFWTQSGF
jgi:hypothetical protein